MSPHRFIAVLALLLAVSSIGVLALAGGQGSAVGSAREATPLA